MSSMGQTTVHGRRVFVSHSSATNELAKAVREALRARSHWPRVDLEDLKPGDLWRKKLSSWMLGCDAAVVLVCEQACTSEWVKHEIGVLMTRKLDDDAFHLVVYPIGLERRDVRETFGELPGALRELQMPSGVAAPHPGSSDTELSAIAAGIAAAVPDARQRTPIDRLASRIADDIKGPTKDCITDVVSARDRLAEISFGEEPHDPWLFEQLPNPRNELEDAEVRQRFAHEMCVLALSKYRVPLQELPTDFDLGELIDRGVQAGLDSEVLHWMATRSGSAVIGTTSELVATLSTSGARVLKGVRRPEVFTVNQPATTDDPEGWANGVLEELRFGEVGSRGQSFETVHEAAVEDGQPLFVILTRTEGVTERHLDAAETLLPGVRFVLLPGDDETPGRCGHRVGRPAVGHAVAGAGWRRAAKDEQDMHEARADLREKLGAGGRT